MAAVYKVYCTYAKAEDFCNDHAIRRWQTEIHKANLANQVSEGEISQPLDYQQLIPRQASLRSTKCINCALAVRRSNVSVSPCGEKLAQKPRKNSILSKIGLCMISRNI